MDHPADEHGLQNRFGHFVEEDANRIVPIQDGLFCAWDESGVRFEQTLGKNNHDFAIFEVLNDMPDGGGAVWNTPFG